MTSISPPFRPFLAGAAALVVGCSVDTYPVAVDSAEVRDGRLVAQLDYSGADAEFVVEFSFALEDRDSCPQLAQDARITVTVDGEESELDYETRGEGFGALECAIKCPSLIATDTRCRPARAILRGEAAARAVSSTQLRVSIEDGSSTRTAVFDAVQLERRSPTLREETSIRLDANAPGWTEVEFDRSHEDDIDVWVNQWADNYQVTGRSVPPFISRTQFDAGVFSIRNDAPRGMNRIFFGSSAGTAPEPCDFGACDGMRHLTSLELDIADR